MIFFINFSPLIFIRRFPSVSVESHSRFFQTSAFLTVVLDQVLHELRISELDRPGVFLVQGGYLPHLLFAQSEVEYVQILHHALLMRAFRNRNLFVKPDEQSQTCLNFAMAKKGLLKMNNSPLRQPAQRHLCRTLSVLRADAGQRRVLYDAIHALTA